MTLARESLGLKKFRQVLGVRQSSAALGVGNGIDLSLLTSATTKAAIYRTMTLTFWVTGSAPAFPVTVTTWIPEVVNL